jgi:hypothetical protein
MSAYLVGCDVLGDDWGTPVLVKDASWGKPVMVHGELVGYFDLNVIQKDMNALKTITVGMAQSMLAGAQNVINQAIAKANADNLPGATDRANVYWKLNWHQGTLANLAATPNAIYASGADLEHWCVQAFIEANSVEAGADWIDQAWSQMWAEIQSKIVALPAEVRHAVATAASNTVEDVTGLPIWAWIAISVGALGLGGLILYKFANTQAGAAIAGGVTHAYMK